MNMGNFDQGQVRRMTLPDSDQRLQRVDGELSGRPRRSPAAKIIGGIALVLVAVFVVLMLTGGAEEDEFDPGAASVTATAHVASATSSLR